ncbi:cellulose binding domain-containing protein [Sorangium sp. So ce1036]|uniref:cellulose binding domain-containing protein n=1 Tax=Sorangium sp. So ce1036 TaxID=3133328 RepID=UPI003F11EA4D
MTAPPLELLYLAKERRNASAEINFRILLRNTGSSSLAFSDLTVRYWFTAENASMAPLEFDCDHSSIGGGCDEIEWAFEETSGMYADHYLELGFTAGAGPLPAGADRIIEGRLYTENYSTQDQTNDYSFDTTENALTLWPRITVYHDGALAWGEEP